MVESGFRSRHSGLRDFAFNHCWMEIFITGCTTNCTDPDCLGISAKGKSLFARKVTEGFYTNRRKDLFRALKNYFNYHKESKGRVCLVDGR